MRFFIAEKIGLVNILSILMFFLLMTNEVVANANPRYYALIIGNDIYQDPTNQWRSLKTATTDAKSIHDSLQNNFNFDDIILLLNATRREIIQGLSQLTQMINEGDKVLIYYAGHGYFDENVNIGYWVPVDAEGIDDSTLISNSMLRDKINAIARKAQNTFLISDACFSGSLLREDGRGLTRIAKPDNLREIEIPRYYQKLESKKSAQLFTSGGVEFVDDNYRSSGHSPFTYFLLRELDERKNSVFSASELALTVQKRVTDNALQTPEVGSIYGVGHVGGEFIFRPVSYVGEESQISQLDEIKTSRVNPRKRHSKYKQQSMVIGTSTWLLNWRIQSSATFLENARSDLGIFYGPNLSIRKNRWIGSVRYFTGELTFDSLERMDGDNINVNRMKVKHNELNLHVGYFLNSYVNAAVGYKYGSNDYQFIPVSATDSVFIRTFQDVAHSISLGFLGRFPVNSKSTIFAQLDGVYKFLETESRVTLSSPTTIDSRNFIGYSANVGFIRQFEKSKFQLLASLKMEDYRDQNNSSDRDTFFGAEFALNFLLF